MDVPDDLNAVGPTELDDALFEDLLAGTVDLLDVPPTARGVATLIDRARQPATPRELAARDTTVPAFALIAQSADTGRARRTSALVLRFPIRVVAIATPVALLGVGVAAATDSLPPSTQAAVSQVLSHVGISVPDPQAHPGSDESLRPGAPDNASPGNGVVPTTLGTSPVPTPNGAKTGVTHGSKAIAPPVANGPTSPAGTGFVCTDLSGNAANPARPPTLAGCSQAALTGSVGTLPAGALAQAGRTAITWSSGGTISFEYTTTIPQSKGDQCGADPTSPGNKETEVVLRGTVLPPGNGTVRAKVCVTSTLDVSLLPGTSFKL